MHRSRSMEMRYFYACDQVKRKIFNVAWHPGREILGDYPSKHHSEAHHIHVRPLYVHMRHSPRYLPRAMKPSDLRGCVGTKGKMHAQGLRMPMFPAYRTQARPVAAGAA